MKKWKNHQITAFIIMCIIVNFAGKFIAEKAELPLWLDSIGTVMAAYALGPVVGAITGATVNLAYGAFVPNSYI